ncbi:hypothetical protein EWM64_g1332 [Hericium alpestre]|uniref:Glutaminase A central domain-containing protein n=1 Tax=Hericium alpestre TaxID=135208 RepID=A0A4Z0A860_9AGAM|nr:hypothetical protein EWM64_g1332 [Hericium alpestre]
MSSISSKLQKSDDSGQYAANATSMAETWSTTALNANGQILGSFGDNNSWTLGYNAFADAWLKTGIVSTDVVDAQTTLYKSLLKPGYGYYFGLPIDSQKPSNGSASASWDVFAASIATDKSTSDAIISLARTHASFNKSADIFSDLYDGSSGAVVSGQANVALGAMFAPLILNQLQVGFATPGLSGDSASHSRATAGAIAGGVIGGVVLIGGIALLVVRHFRRRKREREQQEHFALDLGETPPQASEITPFAPYEPYRETDASGNTFTPTVGQHERGLSHSDGTSSSAGASPIPTATSADTRKRMDAYGLTHASLPGPIGEEPDSPHGSSENSNGSAAGDIQREVERLRQEMDVLRAGRERDLLPPIYDKTRH